METEPEPTESPGLGGVPCQIIILSIFPYDQQQEECTFKSQLGLGLGLCSRSKRRVHVDVHVDVGLDLEDSLHVPSTHHQSNSG